MMGGYARIFTSNINNFGCKSNTFPTRGQGALHLARYSQRPSVVMASSDLCDEAISDWRVLKKERSMASQVGIASLRSQ
jgi:hypothetical protein